MAARYALLLLVLPHTFISCVHSSQRSNYGHEVDVRHTLTNLQAYSKVHDASNGSSFQSHVRARERSPGTRAALGAAATIRGGGMDGSGRRNQVGYSQQRTWIQNFCCTPGHEFFAEIPESFIKESLNLIDIERDVEIPYYKEALGLLLGERRIAGSSHSDAGRKASIVQSSAALLYGLLHARFLVSPLGLKVVLEKFSTADYGRCPRVYCQGQAVLPVGESDTPMQSSVKVYCPRCGHLFFPASYVRVCDGAFWGTTLPHLLLLGWPELRMAPNKSQYVPRVFGFKVHSSALGAHVEESEDSTVHGDGIRERL